MLRPGVAATVRPQAGRRALAMKIIKKIGALPRAAALLAALGGAACFGGTDLSRVQVMDANSLATSDLVPYRKLTPADFLARQAPPQLGASEHDVGAFTCLTLLHDGKILVEPVTPAGKSFRAQLPIVSFVALMNRDCSWINRSTHLPPEYILEHEQIHFGIWEVHARRMNADPERIRREVEAVANTADAAVDATKQKISAILAAALDDLRGENDAFDRDTSRGYHPDKQREWRQRLEAELGKLAPAPTRSVARSQPAERRAGDGAPSALR
jgi:hypothetical protein